MIMITFLLAAFIMLLLYSTASAVEITPIFKIAQDYERNPLRANKTWVGNEICIQGELFDIKVIGEDGVEGVILVFVELSKSWGNIIKKEAIVYHFYFVGFPDELTEIDKGQTVTVSGIVKKIELKGEDDTFLVSVIPSRLVQ